MFEHLNFWNLEICHKRIIIINNIFENRERESLSCCLIGWLNESMLNVEWR